ncbi:MAG TPA: bifunctional hydroxymethylpyrimidine kinase/phosphomethylpyrimidine kinase [Verrucomicrobiae bacterium]|nr:bifunctional hydroxymethylpyrimidine kinase/phosphomethylpyrimidine kinase [Verrucomicrobiae bacterium]
MTNRRRIPVALSIAGSDSGGGAGIQADLQTFASLGVHGATAITCLTAQNPKRLTGIHPATPQFVRQQIEAVFAELPPAATKTGMLFSAPIIDAVADFFRGKRHYLIVDPVMVSTSGAALLKPDAVQTLKKRLLPLATLVTPNVDEAEMLTKQRIKDPEDLRTAARRIHADHGCAVLAKGGHLRGLNEAVDIFFDGRVELVLVTPFVRGVATHGTGCTYSAAVAAHCARGLSLAPAVQRAKEFIASAIRGSVRVGRHQVLGW